MDRLEDISSDETLAMDGGDSARLPVIRYQARAAAHHIASECERLLAEVSRPDRTAWRDALGDALIGSRYLLALVDRWLGGAETDTTNRLARFRDELRAPQERICNALTTLLTHVPTEAADGLLLRDARSVLEVTHRLGAADTREQAAGSRTSSPQPPRSSAAPAGRPRLLVVDDDDDSRRALSRLLTRLGYDVSLAANGREALAAADSQPPDLIITDISMPEIDGFELLRRLRGDGALRHIPVIMVSGLDDIQSVVRAIEQGAEDHITKPYEAILLQARVRAALERKRMRDIDLKYLGRVAQLSAAAEAVEQGTYRSEALEQESAQDDELGRLARVFDRMVSGLRSREAQLQNRLKELRREIRQSSDHPAITDADPDASPFSAGDVLADRYQLIGELGRGGMGMVYLARDRQLGEDVAIKVVRRDVLGKDPTLVERLKSEIRLARRISHRNVVRAHDLGEWQGSYFLTMEYVKGITVADLLRTRGRLGVESTLAIATQLADALAVAHDQQIIHRDIKPANLLVDDQGVLKVMDFGLARLTQRSGELTLSGFVVGTPRYMAPEQLFGGDVDARSDLFAVGVVLYECLVGTPPFDGDTPVAVIAHVIDGRPRPIRSVAPEVPRGLVLLIDRLLQKDPDQRVGSALDLAEQLHQIGQGTLRDA